MELTEAQAESMQRIAMHCARRDTGYTSVRSGWGLLERFDTALDAVVEFVHDNGWPTGDFGDLYRSAAAAIKREAYEIDKHLRYARSHWADGPRGEDELAEHITDRIAAWEIVWQLTEKEWQAVWAVAEVMKRDGGHAEAAALVGIPISQLKNRLFAARVRCRPLWVAPGETPPSRKFTTIRPDGTRTKAGEAARTRRAQERAAA